MLGLEPWKHNYSGKNKYRLIPSLFCVNFPWHQMLWAVGSKWAPQASPLLSLQLWWQQIRHLSNTNPNTNTNTKTNEYKYKCRFRYKHKWVPWATPPITVVVVGYIRTDDTCHVWSATPVHPLYIHWIWSAFLDHSTENAFHLTEFVLVYVHETNVILQFYLANGNYIFQPFSGSPAPVTIGEVKISIIWPEK